MGNYAKYASAMKRGVEANLETIRADVRSRGPPAPPSVKTVKTAKTVKTVKTVKAVPTTQAIPSVLPRSTAAAMETMNNITSLPADMPSFVRKKNKYDYERKQARDVLSQFKAPTVTNVSKFISLRRKATNTAKNQTYRNTAKKNLYTMLDKFKTLASTKAATVRKPRRAVLSPVMEEEEEEAPPVTVPKTEKSARTRKVTNNWKREYEMAKANLKRLTGAKNPKAYKVAQLASIRRKGLNNSRLLVDVRSEYAPYRQ